MVYNPHRALELLRIGSGIPNARFREGQEDAIHEVVVGQRRLLVVQKTGWGKSFVYFIAVKLLIEQLVRSGNQRQAADQVSISNSIGSLRHLGTMDWREFVETMSVVERTLRSDPGAAYATMDFASRDRYRHVVEEVAKASGLSEDAVASHAIGLARAGAARHGGDDRTAHVGFYLVDCGLPALERATQARLRPTAALRRAASHSPLWLYLGMIALIRTTSSAWSRSWKSGSWPIATRTCTSAC